ncbi:WbqC family protein [Bacteroidia bacterium]|nr:WbqC family protein [Bacteroidia bacterium]MDB4107025.1 WbqC family protein [Bacteroidia bacterium]MDB9882484.1 WbqC family protein [Bacteroidia bacterium]
MKLHCIGNIGYWIKLMTNNESTLYLNHTFQKQSALSQFEIATSNGRLKLSIPTIKDTRKGKYKDVKINYQSNWQVEHWRSIENAYLKSPFFLYYGYRIESVFKSKHLTLLELNLALFTVIERCLKCEKEFKVNYIKEVYLQKEALTSVESYPQVFDTKNNFEADLSILDLIFNLGPECADYLSKTP